MMPSLSYALGLGNITVFSKLNEPLKLQIELINSKSTQLDSIIVKNASRDIYRRSNLPRPEAFNKVHFKIKKINNGSLIVELTSKRPVREPFITFIAVLKWKSGHINREYTFLLDPPEFIQKQIYKSKTKKVSSNKKASNQKTSSQRAPRKVTHRKIDYSTTIANHVDGDTYTVKRADTLWNIAKKLKPANVSTYQTMQALFALNPQAFINDNINLLKQGQTLDIPTQNEILQINGKAPLPKTSTQTNTKKAASNSLSKQAKSSHAKTATKKNIQQKTQIKTNKAQIDNTNEGQAELRIIPPNEVLLNTPVTSNEDLMIINKALQNSITTIKSLSNENEILSDKIKSLTEQLNKLDGHNRGLNDKIEEINSQLNNQSITQEGASNVSARETTNLASSNAPDNDSTKAIDNNTLKVESDLANNIKTRSFIRELLTSPVITIALAIFTIIILIAILFTIRNQNEKRKQRKQDTHKTFPDSIKEKDPLTQTQVIAKTYGEDSQNKVSASATSLQGTDISDDNDEKDEEDMDFFEYFEKKINAPDSVMLSPKKTTQKLTPETENTSEISFNLDISPDEIEAYEKSISEPEKKSVSTTLSEIDTYLAYGNYAEAEKRLIDEIKRTPNDKNLHLKLFECYTYSNNRYEFIQHAENNIKLLNIDMVLRHRVENIFQQTWNEALDINSFN